MGPNMRNYAEVILIGGGIVTEQKLITALNERGKTVARAEFTEISDALRASPQCDTLIFNLEGSQSDQDFTICSKIAAAIKANPKTSHIRIVCIGISERIITSATYAQFDDLMFGQPRIPAIVARVTALQRLKTMHAELQRRNTISEKYGVQPDIPINFAGNDKRKAKILVTGREKGFTRIETTLRECADVSLNLSLRASLETLEREKYDMLIINGGITPTRYLEFVSKIRQNHAFYNLPILLIANPSKLSDSHIAYTAGITDIIDSPVHEKELLVRVDSLVEEKRFRSSMDRAYHGVRQFSTHDSLTGLYVHGFFYEHLSEIIKNSKNTASHFSLISLKIENLEKINEDFGYAAGDTVLRQIGEILMLIVRGEDLASRFSARHFILTLPDTNAGHAANVVKRIEGIVQNTAFMPPLETKPIAVQLSAEIIESRGETNPKQILNRLGQAGESNKPQNSDYAA